MMKLNFFLLTFIFVGNGKPISLAGLFAPQLRRESTSIFTGCNSRAFTQKTKEKQERTSVSMGEGKWLWLDLFMPVLRERPFHEKSERSIK